MGIGHETRTNKWGYYFTLPFILIFLCFQVYPIVYSINLAFTDLAGWKTDYNYVGLDNFKAILTNDIFLKSLSNTGLIWVLNFIPQLGFALLLATIFTNKQLNLKGVRFFQSAIYLPNIITSASLAVLFFSLFGYPSGPINQIFQSWGWIEEPINYFRQPWTARFIVAFIQFWIWYGNTTIILMAAMVGISPDIFESTQIDGASSWMVFRKITLPLIKTILIYVLLTSFIGGLNLFDIPYLLTNGGPNYATETAGTFIYKQAFFGGKAFYLASVASVILLVIAAIGSVFMFRLQREKGEKR